MLSTIEHLQYQYLKCYLPLNERENNLYTFIVINFAFLGYLSKKKKKKERKGENSVIRENS